MSEFYTIKNWSEYQHYKDRNPPWVKLHWNLLTSMDWMVLDDASRVLAIACMLVASRNNGRIQADLQGLKYLEKVAHLNSPPDLKPLVDCGFLASAAIAPRKRGDSPKKRREEKRESTRAKGPVPEDFAISPEVMAWAGKHGFDKLEQHLESFIAKCKANGYKYADWDAAFREAIRADWAGIRKLTVVPPMYTRQGVM